MKKAFAVEHVRSLLTLTFVGFPLIIGGAGLGLYLAFGEGGDPESMMYIGIALVAALVVSIGITLFYGLTLARPQHFVEDMERMRTGDNWAHWNYDAQLWKSANRIEAARQQRGFVRAWFGVGIGAVVLLIGLPMDREDGAALVFAGVLTIAVSVIAVVLMWLTGSSTFARNGRTGELYISALGVLRRPGGYAAFASMGARLKAVELVPGAPMRIVFTAVRPAGDGSRTGDRTADVLVPHGKEDEARALVERFATEVLVARR